MFLRWVYIPPLLIYVSAGVSGLTNIVGVFFLKDYLNLSATFIASLGFWVGIPWSLKMPVGFLVDKFWKIRDYLVYLGSLIIFISLLIMFLLLTDRTFMEIYFESEKWYIISAILTPIGYVIQDVVADAMTVEAVEGRFKKTYKNAATIKLIKKEHTILQMYGRFAIILGSLIVSIINLSMFSNVDVSNEIILNNTYANIYLYALFIPFLSVSGIIANNIFNRKTLNINYKASNLDYKIFYGSIVFVVIALFLGSAKIPYSQEIVLLTSLFLIAILMKFLMKTLDKEQRNTIIGTAIIIFVYRSIPGPGPGINWFEIDILNFDQAFLSLLSIIATSITLVSLIIFKKAMIQSSIARLFIFLSIISSLLYLPSIFMYYGIHEITSNYTYGLVDARFIAIINVGIESPVGQIAMIPLLAWIARNAPLKYKATFFAVFASFTNLALSARELFTKYINQTFVVERQVIEPVTKEVLINADYTNLDNILIIVSLCTLIIPIITILLIQKSKFSSKD